MDNLPPAGFQFSGDDYGPVDFPSSLPAELQAGMSFPGGGPVFPQNQRSGTYGMPTFHMNYSQQASMPSMSSLPSGSFRSRFAEYPTDQAPHLPMPIPSPSAGVISDRLPSFSTIVSSSSSVGGSSTSDPAKTSQALYSSMAGQQHAFQPSGSRGLQTHFEPGSYPDQGSSGKNYSKSSPLGSTSPGMSSSSYSNIPHSSVMQHSSHNGNSQHLSSVSRTFKGDDPGSLAQQPFMGSSMRGYSHSIVQGNQPQESMTLPKFKHKYLAHTQQMPRRPIGPFKFFILGKTERRTTFNVGTQTKEELVGELKIKIPKTEIYKSGSETEMSEEEDHKGRRQKGSRNRSSSGVSPRITFPYDPVPSHGGEYSDFNKNSKVKTIISPSFMDSAGKATMTTCVANKATIVTVGIVSRPTNLVRAMSTNSSRGKGIMATGNGYRGQGNQMNNRKVEADNFEQLMEERKAKARDLEQERMEVSVRIDDTQYIQVGNSKRWQCNECEKSYTTKHNLVMHVLDHSGIKPHLCLKCGKYFKQLSHLNTHMLTHDQIKPHTCQMCGKGFTQISHLKRHTSVSEKNGYCANLRSKNSSGQSPIIQMEAAQRQMMSAHAKRFSGHNLNQSLSLKEDSDSDDQSPDKNTGKVMCRYCDRRFRYPSQLKDHMHSHNGHRPYMCTECGMDFMKEHHLKAHQFTHTGLKPFTCDQCGRSFNQRANLARHKLIHQTNRTFKCNVCNKLFTQPQTLKAHMVVHADRKPYECTVCGKEFGRYHNLQGHMHMHTNSKPYVCFCGSAFTLKGNLNRHKKVKHGLNETQDVMEEDAVNFLSSLSERARDEQTADGEGSLSAGEDSGDGKFGRKGRKSIPRKITQEEEAEGASFPVESGAGGEEGAVQKPFVIQNPDTDEEAEEEDQNQNGVKMQELPPAAPMQAPAVMNFQPLNTAALPPAPGQDMGMDALRGKRIRDEEQMDGGDKRPRRQSQRRSPKVHTDVDGESEDDGDSGVADHEDADWVPGSKRRPKGKVDS